MCYCYFIYMKRAFFFHEWWHDIIWQETALPLKFSKKRRRKWMVLLHTSIFKSGPKQDANLLIAGKCIVLKKDSSWKGIWLLKSESNDWRKVHPLLQISTYLLIFFRELTERLYRNNWYSISTIPSSSSMKKVITCAWLCRMSMVYGCLPVHGAHHLLPYSMREVYS